MLIVLSCDLGGTVPQSRYKITKYFATLQAINPLENTYMNLYELK